MSSNPPGLYAPALYAASLTGPLGARLLVAVLLERVARGKQVAVGDVRLGQLVHRDPRTVRRWVREAKRRGWVQVIRRGRGGVNIYRLSWRLFARLTGRRRARLDAELQGRLFRLGQYVGVNPDEMRRRGVVGRR